MKCTIERSSLLKALSHVQGVVGKRTTVPILAHMYLETQSGRLDLRATDMDLEIAETVFCETERDGRATAPAHTIYEIVKKLPKGGYITLEHYPDKEQLMLTFGKSSFSLKTLPVSDFPSFTEDALPVTFTVQAKDFRSLIGRTYFAMSTEATRYYLNGISLYAAVRDESIHVLRAVATDGYRLARMEIPLPKNASHVPSIIIPRKTVEIILVLIESLNTDITLSLSQTKIIVSFGSEIVLLSKLLEGAFPDCERVIPQHNDKTIEVNAKSLAESVGRVSTVMATDKTRAIKMAVRRERVVLSASNATTTDSAVDELDAACTLTPFSIGFNSRYLLDILGQIGGETVCFAVSDTSSPTVVRELSDDSALYLLMPMRV